MSRIQAREIAMKVIYGKMFVEDFDEESANSLDLYETLTDPSDLEFVAQILNSTAEHYTDLTTIMNDSLKGYSANRVFKIDMAIIFVAMSEILYIKCNPKEIVINEAVEMAKKYSTDKSPKFINGYLADWIKYIKE